MKQLSCADMGDSRCSFVAKGENEKEVMNKMMNHIKMDHPAQATMPEDDMMKMMKDKMRTV